jgi:hypothetical protein
MKNLFLSICLFGIAQSMVWFQTNGQFISEWIKKSPWTISLLGIPISYLYIRGTNFAYQHFNQLWPGRILAFSVGIVIFTLLTWSLTGEGLNTKTAASIILALLIILIQLLP